jgi:tetratricopeptide (TPR) repeat protein
VVGGAVLVGCLAALAFGAFAFTERAGDPVAWGQQKWEAFKTDDASGMEESRYLSASGSGRYTLWEVAWEDFETHPILGVGTHNYEATLYQLRDQYLGHVRQPHSLPLEVLAERGVVGGALFFGFLAACLAAGLWQRFRRLNAEGKAQVGAATAAVAYWFVHSSAEWFWQLPAVTLPAIVYLAVLAAPWNRESGEAAAPTGWPLRAAGAVVAVVAVAAIAPLYLADLYLQSGREAQDPRVALRAVERAQSINPVDYWAARQEAELALFGGAWARAEESYRRAIRLNPEHYEPYYQLAQLKEGLGAREEALSLYRKAHSLNPLDEQIEGRLTQLEKKMAGDESATPDDVGPDAPDD